MDHSSEKRDLCLMKWPSETLQTAIYLEYENPLVLVVYIYEEILTRFSGTIYQAQTLKLWGL